MQINFDKPFELEKKRSRLALQGHYSELFKTYSLRNYEIEDKNNPNFWDNLNLRKYTTKENNPMAYDRLKIVSEFLKDQTKVLNVGAGTGDLENIVLKKLNKKLMWYGIDISPKSIKKLKNEFPHSNFDKGNICKISFEDNFFDYIILMEILEHVKPSRTFKALREAGRVLKDKGFMIITIPLNEGLEGMIRRGENPNAHVRVYTPELIAAELKIAGFKVLWRKFLFAFNKNYLLKTLVAKYVLPGIRQPNNLILFCQKK